MGRFNGMAPYCSATFSILSSSDETTIASALLEYLPAAIDQAAVTVEIGKRVPNGAVYVAKSQWLVESLARDIQAPFDGPEPAWHFMPSDRSIDIDTEADFARAQRMLVA